MAGYPIVLLTEEVVGLAEEIVGHQLYGFVSGAGSRPSSDRLYAMDMPRIETLDQANHFILGPSAYEGAPSPLKAPLTSWRRPEAGTSSEPSTNGHLLETVPARDPASIPS